MDISKSKPSHQEVFNNKKEFSNKVQARNLKGTAEILTHTENLKIVNDRDKRLFLNAINFYGRDLCGVVFQLRQVVIRIIGDEQSVRELQNVIAELSKIVLSIQELLNLETEEIRSQLKGIVTNVNFQVEKLLKIVEYDDLHEYKQKVLDSQLDIVIFTDALKFHVQHFNLSLSELEKSCHEIIENVGKNLHQIKSGHEVDTDDFVHYMRHSVHHIQKHVDHLRKLNTTEHFQNDVRDTLKRTLAVGDDFVECILETLRSENPMQNTLDVIGHCDQALSKNCVEFQTNLNSDNDELNDLINSLYIFGLTGLNAINQSLEDGVMKK